MSSKPKLISADDLTLEIQNLFEQRRAKNSRYSVKRFAEQLSVNESTLYKLLQGRRRLGKHIAQELALAMGYELGSAPTPKKREAVVKKSASTIATTSLDSISWMHMAILESFKLADFTPSSDWISKHFGLSRTETDRLLTEMEKAGILERNGSTWTDLLEDAMTERIGEFTTETMRRIQESFMNVSVRALKTVPVEEREHTLIVFPTSLKEVTRLKKRIRTFMRDVAEQAQRSRTPKNTVYGITVGLIPLTRGSLEK